MRVQLRKERAKHFMAFLAAIERDVLVAGAFGKIGWVEDDSVELALHFGKQIRLHRSNAFRREQGDCLRIDVRGKHAHDFF